MSANVRKEPLFRSVTAWADIFNSMVLWTCCAVTFHKRRRATSDFLEKLLRWFNYFAGDLKLIADSLVNIRHYAFRHKKRKQPILDRMLPSILWIYCVFNFCMHAILMLRCLPLMFELVTFSRECISSLCVVIWNRILLTVLKRRYDIDMEILCSCWNDSSLWMNRVLAIEM